MSAANNNFTAVNDAANVSGKDTLDKLGMVIEIAKAGGNPDWDDLARRLGSASGASVKKTWQNLAKNHVLRSKGEVDPLAPKPAKVTKTKAPRKKAAPKKKVVKDVDSEDDEAAANATAMKFEDEFDGED